MKRNDAVWQRAMYLTSKPNFNQDVKAARQANNLPLDGFASSDDLEKWREAHVYKKPDGNDIEEAIDLSVARIIAKPEYGLSPGWQHSVKRFLLLNDVEDMELPLGLESTFVYDELTGRPTVHVVVTEDVTEDDYKGHWKRIEKWRKALNLEPQARLRKADQDRLRRGKLAYDLWVGGKSYSEVAPILEKQFPQLLNPGLDVVSADDAKTIVRNFIKQSGI